MKTKVFLLALFTLFCSFIPISISPYQDRYPKNVFRSPLDIPMVLSGTFGELRNNHFHAGLDLKTEGRENLNIYAIEDGYVSRINISPTGYGNALYIDHYNGFTSVYAHLNSLGDRIQSYIKSQQYAQQAFKVDVQVPPNVLNVSKGEIIAKSGNTGSSMAPHLHFEIRDTYTEEALNPLLFGYKIADTRKPIISGVAIYPFDNYGRQIKPKVYKVSKEKDQYKIAYNTIKLNAPQIGIGIKAYDKQNGASNLNGVYSIEVLDNGNPVFYFDVERIAFDQSRYINSHIDFHRNKEGKGRMQKCFVEPGNQLAAYKKLMNRGVININDGQRHQITCIVKDIKGNTSTISYGVQYDATKPASVAKYGNYQSLFSFGTENYYYNDFIQLNFPYGSFYKDIPFSYSSNPSSKSNVFSPLHKVHTGKTPVHKYFDVALRPINLPFYLHEKALIAVKNVKGSVRSLGGEWQGEFLKSTHKEFGTFYVTVDTIAPIIKPVTIFNGKNMSKNKTITFKISDNLAGIKSYNGYIDGQWVLMEYDAKTARLRYRFDERVSKGKHQMRLVVTDGRDNVKTYTANFIR